MQEGNVDDDSFVQRVARIFETGPLARYALEKGLAHFGDDNVGSKQRAKLIWNEITFLDHQSRMSDQAISLNLLLQAA